VQQARGELDQARNEFKHKKAELEARVKEVDRYAKDLERQQRELQRASMESLQTRLSPSRAHAAEQIDEPEVDETEVESSAAAAGLAAGVESDEDVHEPWTPMDDESWTEPLETEEPVAGITYEAAALPTPEKSRRPAWVIPVGVAAFLILLVGTAVGLNRRHSTESALSVIASYPVPQAPQSAVPLPGDPVVDSAAGVIAPSTLPDSDEFTVLRDSIAAADARREARQAAAEKAGQRAAAHTITDKNGVTWTTVAPPPLDVVKRQMDSAAAAASRPNPRQDSARGDSTRKDTSKAKPDTVVKPDTGRARKKTADR
jgi:hypothetical protein